MILKEFAELLFPRKCCVCGEILEMDEQHICQTCLSDIPYTYFWNWRENPAEKILWGRTYFQNVVSLFYYSRDNDYSRLVRKVKYENGIPLGHYLGRKLGEFSKELFRDVDLIVPVPVHPLRCFTRGYNQAKVISQGISSGLGGVPLECSLLKRKRYSSSQTKISMDAKWENVKGSFALSSPKAAERVKGKHILLVDDVLTSGATAQVCFELLQHIDGVRVSFATLAFVQK